MALVSIIIPVYNGERFIRKSIASALSQNFKDVEVVVVNDGSTDGIDNVMMEFDGSDSRIRYISIENSGVTAARKVGIDNASGDWICFLDTDDILPSDAIEKYSAFLDDNPDIVASGEPELTLEQYKCGLMRRKSHPELWGKLFSANFIKAHYPPLDRSIIIGEDQIINLVLANNATKLATIPELLYRYNLENSESVTKRFRRTAGYEVKFERLFDNLVLPGFESSTDALCYAEYKMKIEGFKMVVLDGNRFDHHCLEWKAVIEYYDKYPEQLAISEKLLIRLEAWQWAYEMIMKVVLKFKDCLTNYNSWFYFF